MKRDKIVDYIRKRPYVYLVIKNLYQFIFFNKFLGQIFWLKARYLHFMKHFSYDPCLCGNNEYDIYLDYGKKKMLLCTHCKLIRNFPKPENGIYEKDMAIAYQNNPEVGLQLKEVCMLLKKYVSLDAKILDFGCGDGRAMSFLKELGFKNIYGLEISNYLSQIAKKYGFPVFNNFNEISSDIHFDVVIANHVFEHILNLDEVLNAIIILMANNAVLVALVPNIRSKLMHDSYRDMLWDTHYWQFDPETLKNIFKTNKLNVIECKTMIEKPKMGLRISNPQTNGNEGDGLYIIAKK